MASFIMRRAEALAECQQTMTKVYGEWTKEKAVEWRPKPYADNKSRYLWTDAFGVCNFVSLAKETGLAHYLDQADALIRDVHDTLGRDRYGKRLPNATDAQPLNGGLRIGKVHDEDHPDGDGQYFHYLTKWAFALNCMSVARNDKRYNDLAVQLIKAIHPRFLFTMNAMRPRLSWKMSIDLSRPLVPSEGNLDPYDGYVTYRLVQQTHGEASVLKSEIEDMRRIVAAKWERYSSSDPLDLGEALWLTHWFPQEDWATHIARRSLHSLESLFELDMLLHHSHRLAFREFGTALGLRVHPMAQTSEWQRRVEKLLGEWAPEVWSHDADITPVMYCAALLPGVWRRDDAVKA